MSRISVMIALILVSLTITTVVFAPRAYASIHTVEDVKALFSDWTADVAVANGYAADPSCVDGRIAGAPELGTMGFHYLNGILFDTTLDLANPELMLIDPDGVTVVAIEYIVAWETGSTAPTLFGETMEGPMVGHSPGMPIHYDTHVWIADNPAGQFADFNPGLALCPEGTLPPPPTAESVGAIFTGMSADAAVAIGYTPDPFCIDGSLFGDASLGSMGFHYFNASLAAAPLNPMTPPILLIHPTDGTVAGVEYAALDQGQSAPSIFGQAFDGPMPGHGPEDPLHYDLHMWGVENPAGRFSPFNSALPACAASTLPPAPPAIETPSVGDTRVPVWMGGVAGILGLMLVSVGAYVTRRRVIA